MKGQIIAMGGGGFLMEPANPLLDAHLLKLSPADRPRICHFPHATSDPLRKLVDFYSRFTPWPCQPSHLSLFAPHTADIEGFLMEQDIIYVGGGNTRSMLALWREWDLPRILNKACANGTILAGVSAGANCWFEQCSTDSIPGRLSMLPALGWLPGSFTPHYDGEAERRPTLHHMLKAGDIRPGLAADDGAAAHFIDGSLHEAIASRPDAALYEVAVVDGEVTENRMATRYLG